MVRNTVILFVLLFICQPILATASQSSAKTTKDTLVFCRVSENPKKHIKNIKPLLDYVVSKLAHVGITKGEVLFAKNNEQVVDYLRQGKIDWLTETPFSAVTFEQKGNAEILLLRWKKGVDKYHTLFVTRKDSGIKSLHDLTGKKLAVEDRGSTSGYLLPISSILKENISVTEIASPREEASANMVAFAMARQEVNISNMIYRNIMDAGVLSNLDWLEKDRVNSKMKEELVIFHRTQDVPRALELVRSNLAPEIKLALKEVLLNADKDPEGKAALKAYKKTKKFTELTNSEQEDMKNVRRLSEFLSNELL